MKISVLRRLLSFLLVAAMVLGILPYVATTEVAAEEYYVGVRNALSGLGWPVATRVTSLPDNMSGLWIIANYHLRADDQANSRKYIMDPDRYRSWGTSDGFDQTHWGFEAQAAGKLATDANKLNLNYSKYFTRITGTRSSMTLQAYDGRYWDLTYINGYEYGNFQLTGYAAKYSIQDAGNSSYRIKRNDANLCCYMNGYTFRVADTTKLSTSKYTQYQLEFYKVSEEVLGLRDVIQESLKYVVDNSGGRFDQDTYNAYLNFVHSAAVTFNEKFREVSYDKVDINALNALKQEIWNWMAKMKLADTSEEYMDIPIEVLDFRGDGFLFESSDTWSSPYSLSYNSPGKNAAVGSAEKFPGNYVKNYTGSAWTDNFQIEGLVEPELVNGRIVYTPETVNYIAYHLSQKSYIKSKSGKMNGAFIDKINSNTLVAGSYDATLAKCEPAVAGGELHWNQVTTFHDMAYYLLSHMWTETHDVLGTDTYVNGTTANITYNTEATELSKLRLYKNGQTYSYAATYLGSTYDYGYIFNDGTERPRADPWFRPLTGKGFESADRYGQYTEGASYMPEVNYSFTVHAYGGFIFTEDSDLYFTFGGDDDVYFFINGQLVCDIGGIHGMVTKTVKLNELAASLGLKDGQICRFDMFHAERHTSGINFALSTNIQIMDESAIAEKTQYDPETDQPLGDGAALNTGSEIAYAFSILNRRNSCVQDVKFSDPQIGVTLDSVQNTLSLNAATTLSQLSVMYTTYDPYTMELSQAEPEVITDYDTMKNILSTAVSKTASVSPLEKDSYTYAPKSSAELLGLLQLGIPAYTKLTVKGFRFYVPKGQFVNSLSTVCTPMEYGSTGEVVKLDTIAGVASCRINGMNLENITIHKPYSLIMDYGKAVEIAPKDADTFITIGSGMHMEYIGSTFNGDHGMVRAKEPINLTFNAAGQTYETEQGTFRMVDNNTLRYSPKSFVESIDTFYAVYKVTMDGEASFKAYLMVAVEFIPANRVYYEAEDFVQEISYTQKTTSNSVVTMEDEWTLKGQRTDVVQMASPTDEEIRIPDYSKATNVVFFGFDNDAAAAERYSLPQYKNTNFDQSQWSGGSSKFVQSTKIENGYLHIVPKVNVPQTSYSKDGVAGAGAAALHPDCSKDGNMFSDASQKALNYVPTGADVYQIRFKMKNLDTKIDQNNKKTLPYMGLHIWCTDKNGDPYKNSDGQVDAARCITNYQFDYDLLNTDEYLTWTLPLGNQFAGVGTVWGVRAYFGNVFGSLEGKAGYLDVDYIYMGPADMAPYQEAYGYDPIYEAEGELSSGASLYTEGNGIITPSNPNPANYTQAQFSFTGTGFDIISRTGPDQAAIRIEIFNKETCSQDDLVNYATVQLKGEKDKYQIPVYSKQGLDHGTYWVRISVNSKYTVPNIPVLSRGNQFYFDGLIIYDPIDTTTSAGTTALRAYCDDGEGYPVVKEIRDILLSAEKFSEIGKTGYTTTAGAVFVDYTSVPKANIPDLDENGDPTGETVNIAPGLTISNHLVTEVVTYDKVGPKNEVYLGPQQAIAFKLVVYSQELPSRIDIGAKAIMDRGPILCIETATADQTSTGIFSRPVNGNSVRYFSLSLNKEIFVSTVDDDDVPCYVTYIAISNKAKRTTDGTEPVLSVTDIKIAYTEEPTPKTADSAPDSGGASDAPVKGTTRNNEAFEPVAFVVDGNTLPVLESLLLEYENEIELEEDEELVVAPATLSFSGASVALQSDLTIYYRVKESFFTDMGFTDPYVVICDNGTETVVRDYSVKDGSYAFAYRNIAPHRMGDTLTATLYATYNGQLYASESRDYSVADYCYNMLGKTAGNSTYATLRTLLVDLLLYGEMSQQYTGYRTDSLCTARLTEEQLAMGTELTRELVNLRDQNYGTISDPTVTWMGAGLNLRESVAVRFLIRAESFDDLEVRIDLDGKTYVIQEQDFEYRTDGCYVHFRSINAAQMSEPLYVTVYRNGEQVSNTVRYSIESYAYAKQNDTATPHLAELVKRMMCYGDSARVYVGR